MIKWVVSSTSWRGRLRFMGSRTIINVATSIVINLLHRCCSQNELGFAGGGREKTINKRT